MEFDMWKTVWSLLASCTLMATVVAAETGREVAQRSQEVQFSFKTMRAVGEMTLTRGADAIGQRTFAIELVEHAGAGEHDRARITINGPMALRDTQLISWSSASGDDQQWLVTPRTRRVQRIADRGRQAAFVSSDFSYEDILKWQVDDYDYGHVESGACPAGRCTVVEARPHNRFSSYTKVKVFYDGEYRVSQVEYFGGDAARPRKTLVHSQYVRQGGTWQPTRSVMTNHESETATQIVWSGYQLNAPVDERAMSPASIGR